MKYIHKHNLGFTLIELLVSITIFSIIMISVITIFIFSANLSAKVDINRSMQENIKNAVEAIAEDVRKGDIIGVADGAGSCSLTVDGYQTGNKLCVCLERDDASGLCNEQVDYRLRENNNIPLKKYEFVDAAGGAWPARSNDECDDIITDHCVLFKGDSPLTNSLVSFRELHFIVSGDDKNENKVTINFVMQPTLKRGVRSELVKNSKLVFQTTISERLIQSN